MASNDYYSSYTNNSQPPHRNDAPLPPAPGTHSTQSVSPITSPFDGPFDSRYDYSSSSHQNSAGQPAPTGYDDTGYYGASSQRQGHERYSSTDHNGDPFRDHNAIPLQAHGKMDGSPTRYQADPEGSMYAQGHEKKNKKKKGWFSGRVTWVVYILTAVQIGVFVGELIKQGTLTGSPIATKPFNFMIGPSNHVLINMGGCFQPCMHNVRGLTDSRAEIMWACPNTVGSDLKDMKCTLSELCGMGGVPPQTPGTEITKHDNEPNQWWRFIVPIFLHAGLIHIGFNMLLQLTLGRDIEKQIGSLRFTLLYFAAGIFGFVFGGNYGAPAKVSTGASGSLFGILALVLLDLLYNWGTRRSPIKDLLFLLLDIAIAFVLGLLPIGLDNFAHIGGFLMGLVLGICLLHSPAPLRERLGVDEPPYTTVDTQAPESVDKPGIQVFLKKPVGFFKGRKPLWWAWWLIRAGALVAVLIGFILLLRNFYDFRKECSWCHRLSCLPIKDWCDIGTFKKMEEIPPTANTTPAFLI